MLSAVCDQDLQISWCSDGLMRCKVGSTQVQSVQQVVLSHSIGLGPRSKSSTEIDNHTHHRGVCYRTIIAFW